MNSVKEEIAKNLLFFRQKARLTQKALAESIGVKNNTISQWENGTNAIDAETLFRLCQALDVSVGDLYGIYAHQKDLSLTAEELNLVLQFRNLDDRGKNAVISSLAQESKYIDPSAFSAEMAEEPSVFLSIAARSGDRIQKTVSKKEFEDDLKRLSDSKDTNL